MQRGLKFFLEQSNTLRSYLTGLGQLESDRLQIALGGNRSHLTRTPIPVVTGESALQVDSEERTVAEQVDPSGPQRRTDDSPLTLRR